MKICWNCKHTFETEEIRWATEPHGELIASCPNCGDADIEEAQYCKICGKPFCDDDLDEGICTECSENAVNYSSFREFALEDVSETECSLLEEFLYEYVFNIDYYEIPSGSHPELRALLIGYYDRMVADIESSKQLAPGYEDMHLLPMIREYLKSFRIEWREWVVSKVERGEAI